MTPLRQIDDGDQRVLALVLMLVLALVLVLCRVLALISLRAAHW